MPDSSFRVRAHSSGLRIWLRLRGVVSFANWNHRLPVAVLSRMDGAILHPCSVTFYVFVWVAAFDKDYCPTGKRSSRSRPPKKFASLFFCFAFFYHFRFICKSTGRKAQTEWNEMNRKRAREQFKAQENRMHVGMCTQASLCKWDLRRCCRFHSEYKIAQLPLARLNWPSEYGKCCEGKQISSFASNRV